MRRLSGFSLSFQKLGFSLAKRENPASPAGAQEGRLQWFPPSDFLPFPKIIWCKPETGDRCEKENGRGFFLFVSFSSYSQCQIPCCYTGGFISAGAAQGELPEGQERVPCGIDAQLGSGGYRRHLRVPSDNACYRRLRQGELPQGKRRCPGVQPRRTASDENHIANYHGHHFI